MKKAVNQWIFQDNTSLQEIFAKSSKAGFDGVELNMYPTGDGVGLRLDTTDTNAREIKRMAGSFGLELNTILPAIFDYPLSSSESEIRRKGREILKKQLHLAAVMEMDTVLVIPGRVTPEVTYEECYKRSQQELHTIVEEFGNCGVRIGIENVWNKFLLSPIDMVRYIDELNSSMIGAYFDVGNVLQFGYPEHWIRSLGKRIFKVHLKDFATAVGNINGFVPLLSGDVDWRKVREALLDVGYDDFLTAEVFPYRAYPDQMLEDTARQMDTIIIG